MPVNMDIPSGLSVSFPAQLIDGDKYAWPLVTYWNAASGEILYVDFKIDTQCSVGGVNNYPVSYFTDSQCTSVNKVYLTTSIFPGAIIKTCANDGSSVYWKAPQQAMHIETQVYYLGGAYNTCIPWSTAGYYVVVNPNNLIAVAPPTQLPGSSPFYVSVEPR